MENPPIIKRSPLNWTIEALALLGLLWCFYPLLFYAEMPDRIPTHFNFLGQADGWGRRGDLWYIPVVTLILYTGMTILQRYPHRFNYPVKISESNLPAAYRLSVRMVSGFKLMLTLAFGYISYQTFSMATGDSAPGLGRWFTPVVIAGNIALIIYTISRLNKLK